MNSRKGTFWLSAGAALVAGLLLRLWFISHMPRIAGDSLIYGAIAANWIQHGVYGFASVTTSTGATLVRPTLIRLPGYPLFMAAIFRLFGTVNYRAAMEVQVLADLVTCWLASSLAGRLFGPRAILPVLWIAALCPFTANYVAAPLTETLVLTTIAFTFYGFARWQDAGLGYNCWLWAITAAMAYSLLLRPEQGLLAAAVLPAMLWKSIKTYGRQLRAMSPMVVAGLCVLLPLLPWTIRNWRTFHVFEPLAPRFATDPGELPPIGFGRWYRSWGVEFASTERVYWNYNGDRIELADLPPRAFDAGSPAKSAALRSQTAALLADYNLTTTVTPEIDARFGALAAERVHAHPVLYYLILPAGRLLDMLLRPRTEMMEIPLEWWQCSMHRARTAFAAAYATLNLAYLALGVTGFWVWRRRHWHEGFAELACAMAASLILRSALLLTIDNSEPRYTLEFFPVLFVWAGAVFASQARPASRITAEEGPAGSSLAQHSA